MRTMQYEIVNLLTSRSVNLNHTFSFHLQCPLLGTKMARLPLLPCNGMYPSNKHGNWEFRISLLFVPYSGWLASCERCEKLESARWKPQSILKSLATFSHARQYWEENRSILWYMNFLPLFCRDKHVVSGGGKARIVNGQH